jgi:hypothetical protein
MPRRRDIGIMQAGLDKAGWTDQDLGRRSRGDPRNSESRHEIKRQKCSIGRNRPVYLYLCPGDPVSGEIEKIGRLTHSVVNKKTEFFSEFLYARHPHRMEK